MLFSDLIVKVQVAILISQMGSVPAGAAEAQVSPLVVQTQRSHGTGAMGAVLLKQGWTEIARCWDGHQASYIIEKDSERKLCKGINARGGFTESPCVPFKGDLAKFKTNAVAAGDRGAKPRSAQDTAAMATGTVVADSANNKASCWTGFDQK